MVYDSFKCFSAVNAENVNINNFRTNYTYEHWKAHTHRLVDLIININTIKTNYTYERWKAHTRRLVDQHVHSDNHHFSFLRLVTSSLTRFHAATIRFDTS